MLRDAVEALRRNEATPEHPSPWIVLGLIAAAELWDDEAVSAITANGARHARERGDLQTLRAALHGLAMLEIWHGRFTAADAHLAEFHELSAVIGGARRFARPSRVTLLAWRGDHVRAHDAVTGLTMGPGEPGTIGGYPIQLARTALTVLELGRGAIARLSPAPARSSTTTCPSSATRPCPTSSRPRRAAANRPWRVPRWSGSPNAPPPSARPGRSVCSPAPRPCWPASPNSTTSRPSPALSAPGS
ncbi:hypothetical protein ACFQX6_04750 [Streptosporangium lutulentum]